MASICGHEPELPRLGFRLVPSGDAVEPADLWLCHRRILQPQAGAGDVRSVAFRFIAANDHPDHDTIATFRRRFLSRSKRCSSRC